MKKRKVESDPVMRAITEWDNSEGPKAKQRGGERAMLLPNDVAVLAEAADLAHHEANHQRRERFEKLTADNLGAHFARRSLFRESEGFREAIHARIMFLNFEHPDHATHHAKYMEWSAPQTERSNEQHRKDWTKSYCQYCPDNVFDISEPVYA
jgi:hypothetical protein